jgi:hypothetical protein
MGRKSETNERFFLPAPSSHLHALQQLPDHADRIERIDGTRTRSTGVVVLQVERPKHTQFDLFHFLILLRAPVPRHGTSSPFSLSRWGIACCVLVWPERHRLRPLSTLIPHLFGLCRRSSSNLGFLDHIRKRH